jgi:hypothetical protein
MAVCLYIMPPFFTNKLLLPVILWLLLVSCQRSKQEDPEPVSMRITLEEPLLVNDTTATLTWSGLNNPDFVEYQLLRKEDSTAQDNIRFMSQDAKVIRYQDPAVPYSAYVQYQVVGKLASGQTIASNTVILRRPAIHTLRAYIFDVLYESDTRQLFFLGRRGKIIQYDVATHRIRNTLEVGVPIGYGSLGTYQGKNELYIAGSNGRVYVYDTRTLAKIDEIAVAPAPGAPSIASVVASNGLLFLSTRRWDPVFQYGSPELLVVDRATKSTSAGVSINHAMRLQKVPNTVNDIIGVGQELTPASQTYFRFSAAGTYVFDRPQQTAANRSLEGRRFTFFPAGDRYITGAGGDIFSTPMAYQSSLLPNRSYSCFGFDATEQLLYAGTNDKTIQSFTVNGLRQVGVRKTRWRPFKLFRDGSSGVLALSAPLPYESYYFFSTSDDEAHVLVEHLP